MTATLKVPAATDVDCSRRTVPLYAMLRLKEMPTTRSVVFSDHWAPAVSGNTAPAWGGSSVTWTSPRRGQREIRLRGCEVRVDDPTVLNGRVSAGVRRGRREVPNIVRARGQRERRALVHVDADRARGTSRRPSVHPEIPLRPRGRVLGGRDPRRGREHRGDGDREYRHPDKGRRRSSHRGFLRRADSPGEI